MELFGLHTKDGKEWKFIVSPRYGTVSLDSRMTAKHSFGIDSITPIEPKPEFKVGDWCIGNGEGIYPLNPVRLKRVDGDEVWYDDNFNTSKWIRHATPQEIETHLRKICDEKYIGKNVKCICGVCENSDKAFKITGFSYYNISRDKMYYSITPQITEVVCVYKEGKFAEIAAPLESKKELPKTIEELHDLLYDYGLSNKYQSVNTYLKEQGYKVD